jgi:hypothetical protein
VGFQQQWLNEKLISLQEEARLITAFPDKQTQWNFLHWIFRSKINHLQRTLCEAVCGNFVHSFEAIKRSIFSSVVGVTVDDLSWQQACLPIERGGFGLGFAPLVSFSAHTASSASSYSYIESVFPAHLAAGIVTEHHSYDGNSWIFAFSESIKQLNAVCNFKAEDNGVQMTDLISGRWEVHKLQSSLTSLFERDQLKIFKSKLKNRNRRDMARFHSICGKHAGAYLRALAKEGEFKMSGEEFSTACLFRLGCKFPFISPSLRCNCDTRPVIGEYGEHIHVCKTGGQHIRKHNALVRTLEALANYAGVKTILEPTNCFANNSSAMRPDILLIQPTYTECRHNFVVDAAITHPATDSKIDRNNTDKHRGRAAHLMEQTKRRDYAGMADDNNLHFAPLVCETFGTWGRALTEFVNCNVETGWRKKGMTVYPLSTIKEYWKKRISVTLQKTVARMFLNRIDTINGGQQLKKDEAFYADNIIESRVRVEDIHG